MKDEVAKMTGWFLLSVLSYSGAFEDAVVRQNLEFLESNKRQLLEYTVPQESCGDVVMNRERSLLKYAIDMSRWEVAESLVAMGCMPLNLDERIDILLKCIEIDHVAIFANLFSSEAVSFRDDRNNTLLHFVSYCRADQISTWLNRKLFENTVNDFGWTADDLSGPDCSGSLDIDAPVIDFMDVCDSRSHGIARHEIHHGKREWIDPYGRNLLELSIRFGCSAETVSEVLQSMGDAGGPKSDRLVAIAVYHSHKEIVELLLQEGLPIGEAFLVAMDRADRNEILPILFHFADNYDISRSNPYGFNLGQLAIMRNQCGLVRYLKSRGIQDFGSNCRDLSARELAKSEYARWLSESGRLKGGGDWAPKFIYSDITEMRVVVAFLRQISEAVATDIERLRVRQCDFEIGIEAVELLMAGNLITPFHSEIRPLIAEYVSTVGSLLDQSSFGLELRHANTDFFLAHLGRIRKAFDRLAERYSQKAL